MGDQRGESKQKKKTIVDHMTIRLYNQYGVLIKDGANDLKSYIGVLIRDNISILYDDW